MKKFGLSIGLPALLLAARGDDVSTPTTLFPLLTAAAHGWRQEQVAKNAEAIAALGRELYDRVAVWAKHINDVGAALGRSVEAYNKAAGSMEARVLPSVRRFKELGAAAPRRYPNPRRSSSRPGT